MSRSIAFRGDTGPSAAGVDADAAAFEAQKESLTEMYAKGHAALDAVARLKPTKAFAPAVKRVADRLIALCVLLAGAVQGQSVAPLAAFLRAGSVDCTPEALGLSPAALRGALTSVGELVHTAAPPLMPGVFHFFGSVSDADVDGDGWMDLASASFNDNGKIAWYPNGIYEGAFAAAQSTVSTEASGAASVVAADIDGEMLRAASLDGNDL